MSGPALPWGAAPVEAPAVESDLIKTLGLENGRIEVKWELVDEDAMEDTLEESTNEPQSTIKWWPASISQKDGNTDGEGRFIYTIIYDPDSTTAYEEPETHQVTFLDAHTLYDMGEDELMKWRVEGETWEEEEEDGGDGAMTFAELNENIRQRERIIGKTVDQECGELLSTLPAEKQRVVAAAFADFAGSFAEGVAKVFAEKGEGYVMQKEDIEKIMGKYLPPK